MNPKILSEYLQKSGEPAYRCKQILSAIYSGAKTYDEITTVPKALREDLRINVPILLFRVDTIVSSKDQRSHKARLILSDGKMIETVFMEPKPGYWSVCISSQAGCGLKCSFCATGSMGFRRNLSAEEISDQVLFWKQQKHIPNPDLGFNVVYMGMGEPMLNLNAVRESVETLTSPELFGLSRRAISVSTVGIVPGIKRFSDEFKQVNLAISLHAANDELRSKLVPINKVYSLEALSKSLQMYFAENKRKVFIEYVLLSGVNDSIGHAKELIRFIRKVGYVHLMHVNLIVWNPTNDSFRPTPRGQAVEFKNFLNMRGFNATIRKNLGVEINAACGQLAVRASRKPGVVTTPLA